MTGARKTGNSCQENADARRSARWRCSATQRVIDDTRDDGSTGVGVASTTPIRGKTRTRASAITRRCYIQSLAVVSSRWLSLAVVDSIEGKTMSTTVIDCH